MYSGQKVQKNLRLRVEIVALMRRLVGISPNSESQLVELLVTEEAKRRGLLPERRENEPRPRSLF
jgi:hypothetical protein